MWTVILFVILGLLILRSPKISKYSAVELYKDMKGGDTRANRFVGYLQEDVQQMTTQPYFQGTGYSVPIEDNMRKYMFQDAPDEYDFTKPRDYTYPEPDDFYDYTKKPDFKF
jgi:hypothetical protein